MSAALCMLCTTAEAERAELAAERALWRLRQLGGAAVSAARGGCCLRSVWRCWAPRGQRLGYHSNICLFLFFITASWTGRLETGGLF